MPNATGSGVWIDGTAALYSVTTVPVPPSLAVPMRRLARLVVETNFSAVPPVGVMVSVLPLIEAVNELVAARSIRLPPPRPILDFVGADALSIFSVAPWPLKSMVLVLALAAVASSSVAPDSICNRPVLPATAAPLSFSVPLAASTVPVLTKPKLIVLVPVPPVLAMMPALVSVLLLVPTSAPSSAVKLNAAPAETEISAAVPSRMRPLSLMVPLSNQPMVLPICTPLSVLPPSSTVAVPVVLKLAPNATTPLPVPPMVPFSVPPSYKPSVPSVAMIVPVLFSVP